MSVAPAPNVPDVLSTHPGPEEAGRRGFDLPRLHLRRVGLRHLDLHHRMPLRVKLVAAVLALVFAALVLMAVSSTLALRSYLLQRIDDDLSAASSNLLKNPDTQNMDPLIAPNGPVPLHVRTDYVVALTSTSGVGPILFDERFSLGDLPGLVKGTSALRKRGVHGEQFTVTSANGQIHWRMSMSETANGSILHVARDMTEVEAAVDRLAWIDGLVGAAVLVALAAVGAAVVRQSLIPLVQIERTAGAIAAGDLTRRVPDPEPGSTMPRTELGRLSRALNAMLAQIEMAFVARATSEMAARAAESSARDAAEAARLSEARAVGSEEKMRQFVADASHELRTPLTTIRGFAELYRQGAVADPADVARLVRRIEDEASRMGLLVEDLLLLARLDRERPVAFAPVELPVLAMDAVQAARVTAPERTIELDVQGPGEDLVAFGDDARLRQVIGNLMTNALVHTPPDASITLRLHTEAGNLAVVEIIDTGRGLAPDQVERVFERFYRADEARTRHADRPATSTGLGLAIVAAIVRAHHGTVEVVSEPGAGATFRIRLPLAPSRTSEYSE